MLRSGRGVLSSIRMRRSVDSRREWQVYETLSGLAAERACVARPQEARLATAGRVGRWSAQIRWTCFSMPGASIPAMTRQSSREPCSMNRSGMPMW